MRHKAQCKKSTTTNARLKEVLGVCVGVCVSVCLRKRKKERERGKERCAFVRVGEKYVSLCVRLCVYMSASVVEYMCV